MNKKILIAALVCGVGVFAALKYCCPKSANIDLPVSVKGVVSQSQYSSPVLATLRHDIVASAVLRPAGLREVSEWVKKLDAKSARPGLESIIVWLQDKIQLSELLENATGIFQELAFGVSPKIVETTAAYKFPVFGAVWSHATEDEAIRGEQLLVKNTTGKKVGFEVKEKTDNGYVVSVPFGGVGTASGKLWRKGSLIYLVVGGEAADLFTDSPSEDSRFVKLAASAVSEPLVSMEFESLKFKSLLNGLGDSLKSIEGQLVTFKERISEYDKAGLVMSSLGVTGTSFRGRVCAANLGILKAKAAKSETSRFGNLITDGTVLAYRADSQAIRGFLDTVLLASNTVQTQQAALAPADTAASDLAVSAKRGEDLVKLIQMLLPQNAEAGVILEMPMGGFTPMVMGYLRADNFKAEEFLRTGAAEMNAKIAQNFGDYRLTAKSFDRDGIPYINFFMDGASQPVFLRAAGSDGLAVGISEVSVDQAVARLVSGKNALTTTKDYAGVTIWDRMLASPSATYLSFSPVVGILRPFLPFVVGDGERLPKGITPEDVDYIVQNFTFKILGTGSEFELAGSECRETLWEILPE